MGRQCEDDFSRLVGATSKAAAVLEIVAPRPRDMFVFLVDLVVNEEKERERDMHTHRSECFYMLNT